jgi:nucleoside-specific outer membrane channel protein Tsx
MNWISAGAALGALFLALPAQAGWQSSHLQLLHGNDFILGSPEHTILTLEHARGGAAGDLFVFVDAVSRDDVGSEFYGEAYGQLSLGYLTQQPWRLGPVKDVSLSLGLNAGSQPEAEPFRAWLAGISLDLDSQAFDLLQLDIHAYRDRAVARTGVQITPAWDSTFQIGAQQFRLRGLVNRSDSALLSEPRLAVSDRFG